MTTISLAQVLALHQTLRIYGQRISDFVPRGDLGLGLDPDGPLGFASVRGFERGGTLIKLPEPMVLSVFGEGVAPTNDDHAALPGERIWTMALGDRALHLQVHQGTVSSLLMGTSYLTPRVTP